MALPGGANPVAEAAGFFYLHSLEVTGWDERSRKSAHLIYPLPEMILFTISLIVLTKNVIFLECKFVNQP